jgi:zinc protease
MTGTDLNERLRPLEHRLSNGLTLLVRADPAAPVAAIVTHVMAGYFDEPGPLVGISHVLEHMFFKGTARRGVGEIARATKAAGGYLNAGTIYDRTSYYTVLPAAALDEGLDIQADALIHSRIDEEELQKELVVIIEEVKRKLDNPSALATEKLYEAMFDVHPIRRWRMGMPEILATFTRDDVMTYYRSMYRARNIVLVVSGDVDPERVVDRVEELYGPVPAGGHERQMPQEPERAGGRLRELSGDIGRTYAELGWRTPGTLAPDTAALDALAAVAGQGRASRLYRQVRERGLASSIEAYNYTPTDVGVFGVGLECEPGSASAALRAAWAELDRLRRTPIQEEELERVRTLTEARLIRRLETAEGTANLLAQWQALGHWSRAGDYLTRIQELDPDAIREVADRYLDPDRVTLLVYRPGSAPAIGWADREVAARLATSADSSPAAGPAIITGAAVTEDEVVQYPMGAGRLVVKRRPHAPLVSMAVVRTGGAALEGPESAGLTGLMVRATLKGTSNRTAGRISMESEILGGAISASAGADLVSWSMTVPSSRFEAGLALLADVAASPVFPEDGVATERQMALAGLDRLRDDMYAYPLRLLLSAAFHGHAYGLGVDETARALADASAPDVRSWYERSLGPPWVLVVGDVEPDRVADAVATSLPPAPAVSPPTPAVASWPTGPRSQLVRRERAQTALALAFPGPDRTHADRTALEVLSSAVSGLGNRLFEELRSRRSLAYTVTAFPLLRRYGGAFVAYIATSPDREAEARAALVDELLRLTREPLSGDELERARRYVIGTWQIRTQTNAAQLSDLATALLMGDGLEEIRGMEARTRAVTAEDVLQAAAHWFDRGRLVEGVVRGSAGTGTPDAGAV